LRWSTEGLRLRVFGNGLVVAFEGRQEGVLWMGEAARAFRVEKRASRAWWVDGNILILLYIFG